MKENMILKIVKENRKIQFALLSFFILVLLFWAVSDSILFAIISSAIIVGTLSISTWARNVKKQDEQRIKSLVSILKDDDSQDIEVQHAIQGLGNSGLPAVKPLIKLFRTDDTLTYLRAGQALVEIGEPAVAPLIKLLKSTNEAARVYIGQVLVQIGTPAVGPLIRELDNKKIGTNAAIALAGIGEPAVRPLIGVLKDERKAEIAANVLAEIGKPAVIPLTAALNNQNENIKKWAAAALDTM